MESDAKLKNVAVLDSLTLEDALKNSMEEFKESLGFWGECGNSL